jgi:UDP-glucose 4-epimerase
MHAEAEAWFSGKTVTVLGASGFLGTHLVHRLLPLCARVVSFSRGSATGSMKVLAGSDIVLGDIREPRDVKAAIGSSDVVFNLAGRSGSIESSRHSFSDLEVNVGGLINVLEAAAALPEPPKIVFPGSRLQYGRVSHLPVDETAPQLPLSPYGLHKRFCEEYLAFYGRSKGLRYAVARLTNPFGPYHQRYSFGYNVLNQMIEKARTGDAITVYGDGSQLRDYLYIEDAIDALLVLGAHDENAVVNVGSGTGTRFRAAAETIVRLAGHGEIRSVPWPPDAQGVETGDFVADISAMRKLGWQPRFTFEDGVLATLSAQ